jgi:hypothetical protein
VLRSPLRLLLVLLCLLCCAPAAYAAPGSGSGGSGSGGSGWAAPLAGPLVVRRPFDPPASAWGRGHRGVDLAGVAGEDVLAAGLGVVTYAGLLAGRGVVAVDHGTLRTTYEPVDSPPPVGTVVLPGEAIGTLARGHAGPALPGETLLHWGLLRGDTYLDPLSLLRRAPSRLVPVAPAAVAPADPVPASPVAAAVRPPARVATWAGAQPVPAAVRDPGPRRGPGRRAPAGPLAASALLLGGAGAAVSRAGRRASRAAAARPSYASGRSGSPSRRAPGRSPPA